MILRVYLGSSTVTQIEPEVCVTGRHYQASESFLCSWFHSFFSRHWQFSIKCSHLLKRKVSWFTGILGQPIRSDAGSLHSFCCCCCCYFVPNYFLKEWCKRSHKWMDDLVQVIQKIKVTPTCKSPRNLWEGSLRLSSHHCLPGCACQRDVCHVSLGDPQPFQIGYIVT